MSQSVIKMMDNYVDKLYYHSRKNEFSSVENELMMIDKFNSCHAPKIISRFDRGYRMKRYDYSLGTTEKLKRFCPDFLGEINEIENDLLQSGINHRDINPGNLLYCNAERVLVLIDFYWAIPIGVGAPRIGKLNKYYGEDEKAFKRLRKEYGKSHPSAC